MPDDFNSALNLPSMSQASNNTDFFGADGREKFKVAYGTVSLVNESNTCPVTVKVVEVCADNESPMDKRHNIKAKNLHFIF